MVFLQLGYPCLFFPFHGRHRYEDLCAPTKGLNVVFANGYPYAIRSRRPIDFHSYRDYSMRVVVLVSIFRVSRSFFSDFIYG